MDITRGCNPPANNNYCPNSTLTRGQAAALLRRALDLSTENLPDAFIDDNDSVFENDINALAAAGVTRGCNPPENDFFCPNETLTRGQAAAFLRRGLDLPRSLSDAFTDDDGTTFELDINGLADAGITRGCNPPDNTHYCPNRDLTRGQVAALLRRAFDIPVQD